MSPTDEQFLQSLRATFKIEAAEHLQTIGTGLLELEKASAPAERLRLIEAIFRAAHSLKGAARAVSFHDIESICQGLESQFATWKRGESEATAAALDAAYRAMDRINQAMAGPAATAKPPTAAQASAEQAAPAKSAAAGIATPAPASSAHSAAAPEAKQEAAPPTASAPSGESETVRVRVSSLDERLLEAEELLSAKLAANERASELAVLATRLEQLRKESVRMQPHARVLRRSLERTDAASGAASSAVGDLTSLADFVDWNTDHLRLLESRVATLRRTAEQDRLLVGKLVDDLLENSKKLLMLPLGTLGVLLPKLVRDVSREQGKEVDLVTRGEEVTLDKRILEEVKDPLIHLLRNSIDHGIELPEQRRNAAKPPRATITLAIERVNGNQVEIAVADDGAGMDVSKLKAAAIKRGLLTPDAAERLPEAAALALAFETEVSTSPILTQLSGRGLGLAIVREKAEKLGGRVTIESRDGQGTTIRMRLPLALATFRGVLVEAAQRRFVVPTSHVERVVRFRPQEIQSVEGRESLAVNGRAVALVELAGVLNLPPAQSTATASSAVPALILGAGEQRIAFAVDAVLDEREVLVKRLARPLVRVRNIAGATVLGSGEVAPILNVTDLLKSARSAASAAHRREPVKQAEHAKRVLVAEDSITSRMLLKGILESAGYDVKTAVDGMDAFTTLRAGEFDILVSDVEMPRMNGFDLTARVRADRTLAELPVVLVTALASREDREHGIDVGANAYIVKSDLDQSHLLDALRRLA